MKTMIIAAAAALSLSMGVAYADSEGGQVANTQFTELPGVALPGPGAERPGRRDGAERAGGPRLRRQFEPRNLAVSPQPERRRR